MKSPHAHSVRCPPRGRVSGFGRPGAADTLLTVDALVKRFGAFHALDRLSFALRPGEILGLVGPNGSGKTTCINVISGLYAPDGGRVLLGGTPVAGLAPHRLAHLGINRTFQVPKPFRSLSVRDNVALASAYGRRDAGEADLDALLDSLDLAALAQRPALELNNAQQKMLDLARALATQPRVLLVDELAAGLNPSELERIGARLEAIARSGVGLVVVEHLMGFIDQITDRVIVMNAGRHIFEGTLAAAVHDPQVIEVYLGASDVAAGDVGTGDA